VIERSLSCAWHLPDITWTGSLVAQHSTRSGRKGGLKRTCLVMDRALEKLQQAVEDAMEGLSNEDLSWHPPGKWCAAEVLEHLYLTYTGTVMGFERVLAGGKPIVHPATFRQRCRTLVVVGLGYMPQGQKSPRVALPRGTVSAFLSKSLTKPSRSRGIPLSPWSSSRPGFLGTLPTRGRIFLPSQTKLLLCSKNAPDG